MQTSSKLILANLSLLLIVSIYMLQSTKMVTRNEFSSEVYEEGTDTIVFVYTTAVEDET